MALNRSTRDEHPEDYNVHSTPANLQQLVDVIKDFDIAMLTTVDTDRRFHARPMHIADVADDATITFVISIDNELVKEFTDDNRAGVTLQGNHAFATLSGMLCLDADGTRVEELWSERWRAQFPDGPRDPELRLLNFRPDVGAYWIDGQETGFDELLAAGRSIILGETANPPDTGTHVAVEIDAAER